jgi:hypothetical protein
MAITSMKEAADVVASTQPLLVGCVESDASRSVWSDGQVAVETMLEAIESLRANNIFWSIAIDQVRVNV